MERNYSLDFIKFFAILAVVAIHTGTVRGVQIGGIHGDDVDFVIDTLARFAVPFFFVASGYLLVQRMKEIAQKHPRETMKPQLDYFRKYTIKLVKLWFAWFVFYFLFDLSIKFIETEKTAPALQTMIIDYAANIFTFDLIYYGAGHSQYHLWFLLALIWSVIILFIFMKLKLLPYLVIISLGLNIFGLFGQSYSSFYEVTVNTRDALFFGLFYTSLGGIMGAYAQKIREIAVKVPTFLYAILLLLLAAAQ
ncbi:acyltransferase [Virgibacillus sp. C22-A2]|uniref:Acyltransferase n=1 Tax=Virgibacillus tibetensis TaxID=3042313 RepID=A0ABU6KLC3_9BACI|nr:acyltransferase [Virgibacillus sp. C22-A2]